MDFRLKHCHTLSYSMWALSLSPSLPLSLSPSLSQLAQELPPKPIEHRPLYSTFSRTQQGEVSLWLEILTGDQVGEGELSSLYGVTSINQRLTISVSATNRMYV